MHFYKHVNTFPSFLPPLILLSLFVFCGFFFMIHMEFFWLIFTLGLHSTELSLSKTFSVLFLSCCYVLMVIMKAKLVTLYQIVFIVVIYKSDFRSSLKEVRNRAFRIIWRHKSILAFLSHNIQVAPYPNREKYCFSKRNS